MTNQSFGPLRDDFTHEDQHFFPSSVWWGSANWTTASANHLETGFWSRDHELAKHPREFVSDVIRFSERWETSSNEPAPVFSAVDYDTEAMAEYLAEFGPFGEDSDDFEE
jgi:hypothetical protein